jgi:hypothetical protein
MIAPLAATGNTKNKHGDKGHQEQWTTGCSHMTIFAATFYSFPK